MTNHTLTAASSPLVDVGSWLSALRRYLLVILIGNLVWEALHLPLYTIRQDGTLTELVFAVIHCTGGDILIALSALVLALVLVGDGRWPARGYVVVAALAIAFGLGYTIISEWLNIVVRKSWAYSELMPVIPVIDAGLSPVAQWIVLPLAGFWFARRPLRSRRKPPAVDPQIIPLRSQSHA
jgi:hypothetical protein